MKLRILLALSILPTILCAQNVELEPRWIRETMPISYNDSYVFVRKTAIANTLEGAKGQCFSQLSLDEKIKNGAMVNSRSTSKTSVEQKYNNGHFSETIDRKHISEIEIDNVPFRLQVNTVDEYYRQDPQGQYVYSSLYMVAVSSTPVFDQVYLETHYGFEAGWRSAVVPGWGQFHKGDYKKGALMFGGTLALATGVVLTEVTRADYQQKFGQTHDLAVRKEYLNRHNHWQLARNICIGALAGFYIYNIVDAFNSPGARYVIVKRTDDSGRTYTFAPTVTPEGYPVAAAAVTF